MYIDPLFLDSFPIYAITEQVFISYLFYIQKCVYVKGFLKAELSVNFRFKSMYFSLYVA